MKAIEVSTKPQTRKGVYLLAYLEEYGWIKALYADKVYYAMTGSIVYPTHWMPLPPPPKKKVVPQKKAVAPKKRVAAKKAPVKKAVKKPAKKAAKKTAKKK